MNSQIPVEKDISFNLRMVFCLLVGVVLLYPFAEAGKSFYQSVFPLEIRKMIWSFRTHYFSPYPFIVIALAFVLEEWFPAKRRQNLFSLAVFQDAVWFLFDILSHMTFLLSYGVLIKWFYDHYLSFLTVSVALKWPPFARILFAFLLFDFTQWFSHYLRHRIKFLWHFHAIHHSQTEMNFFTSERIHPFEYFIRKPITFIPMYIFQVHPFGIFWVAFFIHWYTRFYHANIRSNFGWLKYLLVTPQSHRIHHSSEPQHQDKNLAAFLTIWDRLFGTYYANYEEYPETGLDDQNFPLEKQNGFSLIKNYAQQFIYPFSLLLKGRKLS